VRSRTSRRGRRRSERARPHRSGRRGDVAEDQFGLGAGGGREIAGGAGDRRRFQHVARKRSRSRFVSGEQGQRGGVDPRIIVAGPLPELGIGAARALQRLAAAIRRFEAKRDILEQPPFECAVGKVVRARKPARAIIRPGLADAAHPGERHHLQIVEGGIAGRLVEAAAGEVVGGEQVAASERRLAFAPERLNSNRHRLPLRLIVGEGYPSSEGTSSARGARRGRFTCRANAARGWPSQGAWATVDE
jgi:hypothetical protein